MRSWFRVGDVGRRVGEPRGPGSVADLVPCVSGGRRGDVGTGTEADLR